MKSVDLKKGMEIILKSGFGGFLFDNKRRYIRTVKVNGMFGDEIGSCYLHDISCVRLDNLSPWEKIELSPTEVKKMKTIKGAGF